MQGVLADLAAIRLACAFLHHLFFAVSGMNKADLIQQIANQLQRELETLLNASNQAHESATHSESKAENKYDTRGLEAAYLAHGLSVRAQELQQSVALYSQWQPPSFDMDTPIALGALITLEDDCGEQKRLLLAEQGGGLKGRVDGGDVRVVTPKAPLGKALLGREWGDDIELELQGRRQRYQIIELE